MPARPPLEGRLPAFARPSRQPRALHSALRILEQVGRCGAGLSAQEVAASLGLPRATAYRLLNLLVDEQCLVRLPEGRGFALGARVARLAGDATPPRVPRAAREVLAGLRAQVRAGVSLVLCSATALRVGDPDPDVPGPGELLLARHLHASAAGKLLLAEQPRWRDVLPEARLHRLTDRTLTGPAQLDRHLDEVRQHDRSAATGELLPDLACLAVPVRGAAGELVAAVTVSGPCDRAETLGAHLPALRAAAARLAPLLS